MEDIPMIRRRQFSTRTLAVLALLGGAILASGWTRRGIAPGPAPATHLRAALGRTSGGLLAAGFPGFSATGASGGLTGVADFLNSGSYPVTFPDGVTSVEVWFYGAGGGGAYGSSTRYGGCGGAGALAISVAGVTAGETYTVVVGAGGYANGIHEHGEDGGATMLVGPDGVVIVGAGGGGGGFSTGQMGAPGIPIGTPMIGRSAPGCDIGYLPLATLAGGAPLVSEGGDGGSDGLHATSGENGYAFIEY
jgi:hypothetical protein